ncbi:MAG: K(+)-transporting ATPase subunit C [Acidimicrobiales bacterium]
MLRRQLLSALLTTVVLTVLLGLAYPLAVTGVAQLAFSRRANGTLVTDGSKVVGSSLIGQAFTDSSGKPIPRYFQARPSAAGKAPGYDTGATGGSNLGPSEEALRDAVTDRVTAYRELNGLAAGDPVPVDAVTSSGSGVDPDISVANARDQVARVARERGIAVAAVRSLVDAHRVPRPWGILGEDAVNVVDLNLALDRTR